ncbi:unnamed protein product [Boreogadus saida]
MASTLSDGNDRLRKGNLRRATPLAPPLLPAVTARTYDRGFMWRPDTITSLILLYCSKAWTLLSKKSSRLSFSVFWIRSIFTSATVFHERRFNKH